MTNGIYYNSTAGTLNFLVNNQPSIQINSGGTTVISGTTVFNGTISATTIVSPSLDVTITGGTYSQSSGTLNLRNSTGGTVPVSGYFNYITGGTYSAGTITLGTNTGGTTSITDLVGRAGLLGGVNFLSRWSTQYDLQDSRIFDSGSFMGFGSTSPNFSEFLRIDTTYQGLTIDDVYFRNTANGSLGIVSGNDYSGWNGYGEIAIGSRGILLNSTGSGNIGIGDRILASNTIGVQNIGIGGTSVLFNNIDGNDNIGIGYSSLSENASGSNNIGIGTQSLQNTIDSYNIAIGVNAGLTNTTGSRNTYIGFESGTLNDGSNNIFIGYQSGNLDTNSDNKLNIGDTIYGDLSSKLIGINVTNPINTLDVGGNVGITGSISASTYDNLPGSSSLNCYGTFYTSSISGCSPVTILTPLIVTEGLSVTGNTTFFNNVTFSGGSSSFNSGLTASTITSSGNIISSGNITAVNYYGNGSNLTGISRGGGTGGQVYYFNISNTQSPYYEFSTTATTTSQNVLSVSTGASQTAYVGGFMTPSGVPGITTIPAGIMSFYLHCANDTNSYNYDVYCQLYKRTLGGTETLLFTSDSVPVLSDVIEMVISDGFFSGSTLNSTDRLVVKIFATNVTLSTHTFYLYSEGSQHYSFSITTIPSGIISITNGSGISTSTSNGITTVTNTDLGSSQNIFKNIQAGGVTQFSANSNNSNLNFSGINITITSASTNTLVFSASTGGGGSVTSVTAGTGLSGNSTTGAITLINNGVTQITAGSGISVDQSTGNVTITATGGGTGLGLVYTTGNNLNFI